MDASILHNAAKLTAAGGFRCIVPDLYRGKLGVNAEEASHLMGALDWTGAVEDILSAARYLRGSEEGSKAVGVTGFCMGGALSLAAAVRAPAGLISRCAPFYGTPSAGLADPATVKIPVSAHFGAADTHKGFSDAAAADKLEEQLKVSGTTFELHRYPGVGHGFMNDLPEAIERNRSLGNGEPDAAQVALALGRVVSFFQEMSA